MESSNSSPSHSFKEKPRSRHGDPGSRPKILLSAEKQDLGNRDLARRSYGAPIDSPVSASPSRHRSARIVFSPSRNLDRASVKDSSAARDSGKDPSVVRDSAKDSSIARDPVKDPSVSRDSVKDLPVSRDSVREPAEKGSSSGDDDIPSRRSFGFPKRECRIRSSSSDRGDGASLRGNLDRRDASSLRGGLERDGSSSRGGIERDGALRASPRKEFGHEREVRMRRLSPKPKDYMDKHRQKDYLLCRKVMSLMKDRDSTDLDDMDVSSSPKPRFGSVNEEDGCKEQGFTSSENGVRPRNKVVSSTRSCGTGDVAMEEEASDSHEEMKIERSPPIGFFHISKRARSDRDRGRREELANKASQPHTSNEEHEQIGKQKPKPVENSDNAVLTTGKGGKESDICVELGNEGKTDAESTLGAPDSAMVEANSKKQNSNAISNVDEKSDMEEGELEPKDSDTESHKEVDTTNITDEEAVGKVEEREHASPTHDLKAEENQIEKENQPSKSDDGVPRVKDENSKGKEDPVELHALASDDKKQEDEGNSDVKETEDVQLQYKNTASSGNEPPEMTTNTKDVLTFDLLDASKDTKPWNLNAVETAHDSGNELTLSLFTEAVGVGAQGESSERKGHMVGNLGKSKYQQLEENAHTLGGNGEESSQYSGHKQKKLKIEPLQLSLALPGTSAGAEGLDPPNLAVPLEPERSVHSLTHTQTHTQNFSMSQTHTNSDGFTTSFSQSQSFIHNPSCSLNCTSVENQELSCGGSRQVSQGNEQMSQRSWPAVSGNDGMHTLTSVSQERGRHRREIPLYQRILQNGNNIHQGFTSVTGSNRSSGSNHISQRSRQFVPKMQEGPSSSQDHDGSGRQIVTHKDALMERVRQQKAWFASKQQALSGQQGGGETSGREKSIDPSPSNAHRATSPVNDAIIGERNILGEKIGLHEIATEPVAIMAQKLQELPDSFLEGLKGLAKGLLCSFEKREEFITLQDIIRKRQDLTENILLRAHRTQLEILVALKTGMQAYVEEGNRPQTYKALIDIFLQTKCRNIACQQSLPAGGCECRICSNKTGFCHECMCVVCAKFDTDNNTCRWVGCDVCLHWCHTDCALRKSYIAPTASIGDTADATEMQYRCVACDHKSELFGFVKEVFQKCAESWGAETLAKELDCVRRIFHGGEDMRGKQLCWKAEQLLQRLENNIDATEVCRSMLRFLNDGNAELAGAPNKKPSSLKANDNPDLVEKTTSSGGGGNGKRHADNNIDKRALHNKDLIPEERRSTEFQDERARKRAEIEDIESAVRMKQAEANMFQMRADEARQEAGGLQRIISVKREKIDEEYACKYAKLRINEVEERRHKWFEELQSLESAQHDFQKMKIRMEADIKELLLKMELAKRQFA